MFDSFQQHIILALDGSRIEIFVLYFLVVVYSLDVKFLTCYSLKADINNLLLHTFLKENKTRSRSMLLFSWSEIKFHIQWSGRNELFSDLFLALTYDLKNRFG